jgi:hypothetical protein
MTGLARAVLAQIPSIAIENRILLTEEALPLWFLSSTVIGGRRTINGPKPHGSPGGRFAYENRSRSVCDPHHTDDV